MSNMEITAWLLPIVARVLPNLSTLAYVQEQKCVLAFYTNGSMKRIPAPGEGLAFIRQIIAGLEE